jgi:hypothetical protein
MATEKKITITWRNENYGRISDAQAFRYEKDPYPSDTERTKLARMFRKHGFDVHPQRGCWMAEYEPEDACVRLVEALQEAGYTVDNVGAVPDALSSGRTFGV